MSRSYQVPAIRRGAETLARLAESPLPLRLSELARELGYNKSSLHSILSTLEELGWVERDDRRTGFRVGRGLLSLCREAFGVRELAHLARPVMEELAESLGESVFLGSLHGDRVVIDEYVKGPRAMQVASRRGGSLPLVATATGKVFLAGMPRDEALSLLRRAALPRFTERSITDPERFMAEVDRARRRGFATDDEEYLRGIRAMAAPVHHQGQTVAALWAVGFSSRLPEDTVWGAADALLKSVRLLSRLLTSEETRLARGPRTPPDGRTGSERGAPPHPRIWTSAAPPM